MSLKQEIETWVQALARYDNNEFEESLRVFDNIADTSKILFNCGVIHATLGEHDKAVEYYQRSIKCDQYLAVAYFQQGVSNFLVGDFEEALANFNDTLLYLRGNTYIDYEQLGLKFRLYSCEVLFNRGLCYIYLQQEKPGMQDFGYAVKEKMTPDHDVIDDAIKERAVGYTVFSIPVGVVYRPNEAKVKNLKTKDYLGKARLIATSNTTNVSTGFQGADRKQALVREIAGKDDRPPENISYAATNLVHKNLSSRPGREQSAPPTMGRNVFPPTPPPETEKPYKHSSTDFQPPALNGRANSVRNAQSRPLAPYRHYSDVSMTDAPPPKAHVVDVQQNSASSGSSRNEEERIRSMPTQQTYTERPRPSRTASEPRGPPPRRPMYDRTGSAQQRAPLFRETTPQRPYETFSENDVCDEVYKMYTSPQLSSSGRRPISNRATRQPHYIEEEAEYPEESYDTVEYIAAEDGMNFEMMGHPKSNHNNNNNNNSQIPPPPPLQSNYPTRSASKRPIELRKIRVKVHAHDDTRYIMIGPTIEYGDFESKVREKFSIKSQLRIKMQDDGDMITMADQDDLEMLLQSVRSIARKERNEMGKMEVWIQEIAGS